MDDSAFDVSVILVNYNTAALLAPCLDRLAAAVRSLRAQIVVVDNASRDESVSILRGRYGHFTIVENTVNVGFARANNQVLDRVRGRYVLLLNIDAFVEEDTLIRTIEYMDANAGCGVLGVRLVGRDGDMQPSCRYFPTPWNVFVNRTGLNRWFPATRMVDDWQWNHASVRSCDWVPGCYYLIRREVLDSIGLFDSRYFLYYEEVDHCRRVKSAGWDVTYYPHATVVHIGGESAKSDSLLGAGRQVSALQMESELLYFRKHHGLSGALAVLGLTAASDTILAFKAVARMRLASGLAQSWKHTVATFATFWRTGGGRRATR